MSLIPYGIQILDLDDLIEEAQLTAANADEAMAVASTFIKAGLAGGTKSGIILTEADLQAIVWMLDLVKGRTAAAHSAAMRVALARLEGLK